MFSKKATKILKNGGIGVLATDTIYGVVGSALSRRIVSRIYRLRHRNTKKPMIILISSFADLKLFNIKLDNQLRQKLSQFWPGPVSIILPCASKKFSYLHRGTKKLAFRLPAELKLRNLLKKTGPLVAPSANPEGLPPATTIKEAKKYFGSRIDFYLNAGKIVRSPSTLIEIKNNRVIIKRKGALKVKNKKIYEPL